ncbi:uncharacterized protein LOC136071806 isoform X3 [Hydra vulgaris]|uniref:Uncharacterized protein LOC136071806 isoform X3 n=1 Tax=Hydra vulgaris TaxID=6087 RepID=A0ABM4BVM5_HYDVU
MKKIKTYGKVKSKKYITSNDWDSLKDKAHKTEIRDLTCSTPVVVSNTPRVNDIVDDFSKLSILSNYQSTPLVPYNVDAPYEDSCSPCDICSPLLFSTYEEEEEIKRLKKYEKNAKRCLIHTILISSDSIKEDLTKENCIKKVACKEDVILCLSSTLNSSVSSFQRSVSFISSKSKPKIKKVFSAGVLSLDHNSSVVPLSPYGKFKNALSCKENDEDMLLSICEQQCLINIEEYIKRKLSDLEKEGVKGFLKVHKILYCKGCYPSILKDLWEKWDKDHMSENNYPNFGDNQKYIVMETNYGGVDLEHFSVTTFKQSLLILKEIITALSAAEKKLMFEHRDLHWGNVLIDNSQGLLNVSIIDFTLSRLLAELSGSVVDLEARCCTQSNITVSTLNTYIFANFMCRTSSSNLLSIYFFFCGGYITWKVSCGNLLRITFERCRATSTNIIQIYFCDLFLESKTNEKNVTFYKHLKK